MLCPTVETEMVSSLGLDKRGGGLFQAGQNYTPCGQPGIPGCRNGRGEQAKLPRINEGCDEYKKAGISAMFQGSERWDKTIGREITSFGTVFVL